MTTWTPGQPVVTEADQRAWEAWRLARKRDQQRERRRTNYRMDYYPSRRALAELQAERVRMGLSSLPATLDAILELWAELPVEGGR